MGLSTKIIKKARLKEEGRLTTKLLSSRAPSKKNIYLDNVPDSLYQFLLPVSPVNLHQILFGNVIMAGKPYFVYQKTRTIASY